MKELAVEKIDLYFEEDRFFLFGRKIITQRKEEDNGERSSTTTVVPAEGETRGRIVAVGIKKRIRAQSTNVGIGIGCRQGDTVGRRVSGTREASGGRRGTWRECRQDDGGGEEEGGHRYA
jgi:hypothetical protein